MRAQLTSRSDHAVAVQWPYSGRTVAITVAVTVAVSKNIRKYVYYGKATTQRHIYPRNNFLYATCPIPYYLLTATVTATVTATATATVRPLYGHCYNLHAHWQRTATGMTRASVSTRYICRLLHPDSRICVFYLLGALKPLEKARRLKLAPAPCLTVKQVAPELSARTQIPRPPSSNKPPLASYRR